MRNLNIVTDQLPCSFMHSFCLLGTAVLFLFACRQGDTFQEGQLLGRWEITKAERNGRETEYLRRGYFIIEQSMMTINITGADEKGPYKMANNKLVMGGKNFELEVVKNDTLIVKYLAGPNSEFVFHMLKKKKEDVN
ncbi:MAG: hypothetical protein IPP15_02340 [Saprospiraceae bacterium]|uniref:Lipocalin-like domain-containing protein n=1 Tax=Candidatus Opimibacter skivensis TaxID=2982028 RepID=A0A9D7SUL8_9BACT|nr:hypothetical protein [Candidatus Opimibacter skivensis]